MNRKGNRLMELEEAKEIIDDCIEWDTFGRSVRSKKNKLDNKCFTALEIVMKEYKRLQELSKGLRNLYDTYFDAYQKMLKIYERDTRVLQEHLDKENTKVIELQKENEKLGELPYKLIIKIGERQNAFKGKSYIEEAVKYEFEKLIHEIEKLINDLLKEE